MPPTGWKSPRNTNRVNGISISVQPSKSSVNDRFHSSEASALTPPSLISRKIRGPEPGGSGAVFCPYHQKRKPSNVLQSCGSVSKEMSWTIPPNTLML